MIWFIAIVYLAGVTSGAWLAWRLGYNRAVIMYRDRTIEQAHQRAEADRR